MAFKRQEREAAASIMAGDRYCPDPELHELVARADSHERPHDNHDGCNPYDPAHIAGKSLASQERPQPDEWYWRGVHDGQHTSVDGEFSQCPSQERPRSVYLPMDCPVCGRHRVEWDGKVLRCEKCTTSSEWDGFTTERYGSQERPQPGQWGREAAEWHRYLHAERILLPDDGINVDECGPWHHRVFLGKSAPASQERPSIDVERLAEAILRHDADDSWTMGEQLAHDRGHCGNRKCATVIEAIYSRLSGPVGE